MNPNDINPNSSFGKEQIMSPASYGVTNQLSENVILTTLDDVYNWARLSSLWPLMYGTACCFIEFAAMIGSRFDFDRFGLIPRASPRQADLIILAGTLNMKMSQPTMRLYEQMPEPKYVIAMGACMITGGMFSADSYSAVRGADKILPIDVYIPGCPRARRQLWMLSSSFAKKYPMTQCRSGAKLPKPIATIALGTT